MLFVSKILFGYLPFGKYLPWLILFSLCIIISWILNKYRKCKERRTFKKDLNKKTKRGYILTYKELSLTHRELIDTFLRTNNTPINLREFNSYEFRRDDLVYKYKEGMIIFVRLKKDFYNTLKKSKKALVD